MDLNCLRCKTLLSDDYQLIFDETGIELQLDKLLADYFEIDVEEDPSSTQALCEECVNKLIELYDLTEKNQECPDVEENVESVDLTVIEEQEEAAQYVSSDQKNNEAVVSDSCTEEDEFMGFDEEEDDSSLQFENVQYLDELESINTHDYVRNVIKSELEEIIFDRNTVCKFCSEVLKSHTALLMHTSSNHESEAKTYPCIICGMTNEFESVKDLALHVVLKHYDLDEINIYSICPECGKRFSNFIEYNKHSCYRKSIGNRLLQDCAPCSKSFSSNKRYRFHLQFHLEKRRPKACFICDILFSDENDLFEHIMYAHEKQDALICKKCDRACTTKELYDDHMKLHKAVRSYHCKFCSKSYLYKQMLDNHIKRHHLQKNENKCKLCDRSMASKHLLKRHMQVKHHEESEATVHVCPKCGLVGFSEDDTKNHIKHTVCTDAKVTSECLKIVFACEFCELAFNSVDNLKIHRAEHTNQRFQCWICKSEYTEYKKLKTHLITHTKNAPIQNVFPVDRHYVCDHESCDQSYLTWPSLRAHKGRHIIETKFACELCGQAYKTRSQLNCHMKAHENNEEYPCQFCAKVCLSQMALAVHIARKHNTNFKTCPTCKATYSTDEALTEHIEMNHIELKCEYCGKVTKNKRNLQIHVRMVHTKVKRYFCKECDKGYYNKSDLRVHEKAAHSEAHKFKCQHCDFTSSYEASFNAHSLKHASKKPFKCEECSREFTRKTCYKLHVLRHSDIKPFPCPVEECGRSFVTQGILNSHVRDNHPESDRVVKKESSRPLKRKKRDVQEPEPTENRMKYIIMDVGSDVGPMEIECVEGGNEIVLAESGNGQEIVLEYDDQDSDLIMDLNQSEFNEFSLN